MIECPYVGLDAFAPEQAAFFFARDFERDTIINNLMGARLTVLCGPSGVGKSSVLGAGVLHKLRTTAASAVRDGGRTRFVACVYPSLSKSDPAVADELKTWTSEPVHAILRSLQGEIERVYAERVLPALPLTGSLAGTLASWSRLLDTTFLIMLDQFEECFLYHEQGTKPGVFASELAAVVNAPGLPAHVLLSLREDTLAKLDHFKGLIPNIYGNQLPLDYLDRESASTAVTQPVKQYNKLLHEGSEPLRIEDELVEAVLDGVRLSSPAFGGHTAASKAEHDDDAAAIDTTYLQLVMTRLWAEEKIAAGSRVLRLATLNRLGGVENLVQRRLDEAMAGLSRSQRRVATKVLSYLVTPEGSKIALSPTALAEWTGLKKELIASVLLDLAAGSRRVLRTVPGERFELYHDKLAPAVLDWTRVARLREQKARNAGRAAGAILILVLLGGAGIFIEKSEEWRQSSDRAKKMASADEAMTIAYRSLAAKEPTSGLKQYDAAFNLYRQFGEPRKALEALLGKGRAHQLAHQQSEALQTYNEALSIAKESMPMDFGARGAALENLAGLKEAIRNTDEAMRLYGEAVEAYKKAHDAQGAGRVQERLAIHEEGKNKDRAIERYKEAQQSYSLSGDTAGAVRTQDAVRRLSDWGYLLDLHTGVRSALHGPEANVGRNVDKLRLRNAVPIVGNNCISRRHLVIHAGDFGAEDWRSRSGTSVNAQPLPYGDVRQLGNMDIIVMANSHAIQFLTERPEPVRVPEAAWGVFIDGAARRYHYLTQPLYAVDWAPKGFTIKPATQGMAAIWIRKSPDGLTELKYSGAEREIYFRSKDPQQDYEYLEGRLPRDKWWVLDMPAQYRSVGSGNPRSSAGDWFHVIPFLPPPGCRPSASR